MRGEGNHKIPGSFAPENMEKTGAERVKYSLACQHEDAISIKFVSYAQKCPTVLCTFAVALRKESVDRNNLFIIAIDVPPPVALRKESVDRNKPEVRDWFKLQRSLSARRAWIEIYLCRKSAKRDMSLSARRAWIEICVSFILFSSRGESLSARRAWIEILPSTRCSSRTVRRSPQGERG